MHKLARPVFHLALTFTFIMAVLPHPPQLPWQPNDKIQHIVAFATLSALATIAYPERSPLRILLVLLAFGALIEVTQAIPALNRDSDILDLVADASASALVLTLSRILMILSEHSRRTNDQTAED
jgi:hypothetical protein